jgi:sulfofructose kinase
MSNAHRPKMVAVGGACATSIYRVDAVPPLPAKALANALCRVADGMAISAACGFTRLGGEAAIWARVGDDVDGAFIRASLAAEGLDVSAIRVLHPGRSSSVAVIVDRSGQRLVVPFHDPMLDDSAAWLPLDDLRGVAMVHVDARWPAGASLALEAARARGIPTMLDGEIAPREVLARLVPLADFAVFSDAGLLAYTGSSDVDAALVHVAASHDGHVGATCGRDGYAWCERGLLRRVPAPAVEVVDTLAAGDIFHGAFALAILEGQPVADAARFACTAASLKCARFGGRVGCPTRAEVDAARGAGVGG